MIVNQGDVVVSKSGKIYICLEYVNTEKEAWVPNCLVYETKKPTSIHCGLFEKVLTKEEYPEYYL